MASLKQLNQKFIDYVVSALAAGKTIDDLILARPPGWSPQAMVDAVRVVQQHDAKRSQSP
jgi:hypothetical protein